MNRKLQIIGIFAVVGVLLVGATTASAHGQPSLVAQTVSPDNTVLAGTISRLNVGAIVAASLVALIIELALNLLGIGIGMNTINPKYGEDSATPQELGSGAIAWVIISTLVSLFVGGWLAGRFAGIPNNTDGLLHGLVTWALVTLVSVAFLTTTAGRILSGTTALISQGLALAGATVGGVARGAAVQGVGNVAQGAGNALQDATQGTANALQDVVNSRPEVANALRQRDQLLQNIVAEGRQMLQRAGVDANAVRETAQGAAQDMQNAARNAAQNPTQAEQVFSDTLTRILNRTQSVTDNVDRDAVLGMLAERGNMSREQAEQTLRRWEDTFGQARTQAEQTAQEAQRKVEDLRQKAEQKVEELRWQADRTAREVADTTAKAISRIALAAFGAMLLGAIAASAGGAIGAPKATMVTTPVVNPIVVPPAVSTPVTSVPVP
jgi:hypothetical protein